MELQVNQLEIGYAGKIVASAESLNLKTGRLTGIIGINGSGKSTLLKTLQGNLKPIQGEININTKSITDYKQAELAEKISIVSSQLNVSGALQVDEIISLGRQPYTDWLGRLTKVDREIVYDAIKTLQVDELKQRYFNQLSDGQKQRVMIARALAQDTPFILLDEPVTHLDLYHQAIVFDLLKTITHQKNKAVIFSSHQINELLDICDELIIIIDGEILQNTVENWLQNDQLNHLFPNNYIQFDEDNKRFRFLS